MYYNKFKYQFGGRAEFLEKSYNKLAKSGLIGNMTFRDFAGLPPVQQEKLIGKLPNSNINQYRYGGRYKAQLGAAGGGGGGGNMSNMSNNGNAANNLLTWGDNANIKSGLVGLGGSAAQMLGTAIAGDAKADTAQAFAGNIIGGIGSGAAAGAAFGPIGAGIGAALGAIKGTVDSVNARNQYRDDLKENQKTTNVGELKSSYNPQLSNLKHGGTLRYQTSGNMWPAATASDSTAVYNSAVNFNNALKDAGYNQVWETNSQDWFNTFNESIIDKHKKYTDRVTSTIKQQPNITVRTPSGIVKAKDINPVLNTNVEYVKNIRLPLESHTTNRPMEYIYDDTLPYQLIDYRIEPQSRSIWRKGYMGDENRMVRDFINYDPVAVKPYIDRDSKEHLEFQKKYGNYGGAPDPYDPNAVTIDIELPKKPFEPDYFDKYRAGFSPEDYKIIYDLQGKTLKGNNGMLSQMTDADKVAAYKRGSKFEPIPIQLESGYTMTPSMEEVDRMNYDPEYRKQWYDESMQHYLGKNWKQKIGKKYEKGGYAEMEKAYAQSRANLSPNEYSFTGKGKTNIDSEGIKKAGYQVGGNTEMRPYPTFKGQQLPYKYFNELKHGGDFEPHYELQDGGEANVEVESGEAIMADPRGLTLHGGAWSENESPVGMIVKGAEHGEKNAAGTEGIPVSFNDKSANPDGAFVYSKYLTTDGKLAKGKGDTPRDSVAGKVKPLLKYAEKLTKEKMNDKYYNNPVALQAIQEEMQYLKDRAMEGKFMHGLNKLLTKKDRNFNELMDYIVSNNPNNEAKTIEGVGGVEQMTALANNPNVPPMNPQDDPNAQLLEQTKNETLMGMQQDKQLNPEQAMTMKYGGKLPQDILEARMKASGASQNEINSYLTDNYKKGGWIQEATASMKERGTEGVCTGSKFGGPSCPEGSKRYNLAKTFRKMAKSRQEGGYMDEYYNDNDYNEIEDEYIYRNGGYAEAGHYGYKPTGGLAPEGYYVGGYVDKMVYENGGHVGYKPTSYSVAPEGYYIGGYEDRMAYGYGGKYLQESGPMDVPTSLPITPVNTWELDNDQQFDVPNYLNYRNNLRKNQGFKPLDWNKRPTDPKEQLDWDNELKNLKEQLDQEKEFNKDPANKNRPSPFRQSLEMMRECPDYNCPEVMKIGGYMNRYRSGGQMVPTYQNAWRNRQYSQPVNEDYYGESSHITANKTTPYRMGGMMADGGMMGPCPKGFIRVGNDCVPDPNMYGKVDNTYSDQNRQADMYMNEMKRRLSTQAPEEKILDARTIQQGRSKRMHPADTVPIKVNNYTYFPDQESFNKVPYHMSDPQVRGVIPTIQYLKDYSPYKTSHEMGGNIGYSRNQSLYGGMINTKTSPDWVDFRMKGQEGMEMQQAPQPQGDPMLAQARQAMLQGAGQPQGPVADPMMEDKMMQQMEQGMMPGQGQQPQAPQGQPNPINMIAQALPDWFKSDDTQGGLGIFTQPAVTQLRKAGFSDREIATFNPNQAEPNSPIIQFLAQEASTMEEPQGQMQPGMQPGMEQGMEQMRRGGSMKHLRKGEYVKFQMGGSVYEGRVKYYDPYTGNFELSDNY